MSEAQRVVDFPTSVSNAYFMLRQAEYELKELQEQVKEVERRKKRLAEFLEKQIPLTGTDDEGRKTGTMDGVVRVAYLGRSTSWSKVYSDVVTELLPKRKLPAADEILQKHTKFSEYSKFKMEEDV